MMWNACVVGVLALVMAAAPAASQVKSVAGSPTPVATGQAPGRPAVTSAADIERALKAGPQAHIHLTVNFATDSDRIEGAAHAQMHEIARALSYPSLVGWRVMVEGHTDSVGAASYNLDLSYRRAMAVVRALTYHYGIDPYRLSLHGFGEANPIADNHTSWGRALNRRVTLVNLGPWYGRPLEGAPDRTQPQ